MFRWFDERFLQSVLCFMLLIYYFNKEERVHLGKGCYETAYPHKNMLMPAGWSVGNAQI